MLDLLCKNAIGDTLSAHIATYFDTAAAADILSKIMSPSSTFTAPIATFVRRRADTAVEEQKCSTLFDTKDAIGTVETYNDVDDLSPIHFNYRTDRTASTMSLRCQDKRGQSKRKVKDVKRQSCLSISSNHKYDSRSKSESEEEYWPTHERHSHYREGQDPGPTANRKLNVMKEADAVATKSCGFSRISDRI